jgi:apolipoprotein D and lipocalin family protein
MKTLRRLLILTVMSMAMMMPVTTATAATPTTASLTTVDRVDLQRYVGKWYEIARYPNRFQRKCQSDTTATYTIRPDGKVQVVNACRQQDGTITTANGTAKVVDPKTNAKLKVTFFWPFYGDYWIIGLGPNYEYAMVGEPDRKYLWILSRTPTMDETTYQEILRRLESMGYQPGNLMKTPQSK